MRVRVVRDVNAVGPTELSLKAKKTDTLQTCLADYEERKECKWDQMFISGPKAAPQTLTVF